MGRIASSDVRFTLPTTCLVGRSRDCDLVATARDVSARHAMLEWNGADWQLRDLDSRNGTWLDGQRLLAPARPVVLPGARMSFGLEAEPWILEDVSPPELMALCLADEEQRLAQGGYLALPDFDAPEHCIHHNLDGSWSSDNQGHSRAITDREILVMSNAKPWRVHLPGAHPSTWPQDPNVFSMARLRLRLSYSRDEEYVEAVALCGERRLDLKARAHHYTLLLLARHRLADQAAGVADPEQGWIRQDELGSMLRMSDSHLYITIHRARTQLGELGVSDAAGLVERRSGTRQLRLGVGRIELVKLVR